MARRYLPWDRIHSPISKYRRSSDSSFCDHLNADVLFLFAWGIDALKYTKNIASIIEDKFRSALKPIAEDEGGEFYEMFLELTAHIFNA